MTISELKLELDKLNQSIKVLTKNPDIWDLGEFSSEIRQSAKSADDCFLADELCGIMYRLENTSSMLDYLSRPIVGEYILSKNSRGRYECSQHEYTSGDRIEYYSYDEYDEKYKWVRSRVEYNSDIGDYYIVGAPNLISLEGLKVRIRE